MKDDRIFQSDINNIWTIYDVMNSRFNEVLKLSAELCLKYLLN